MKKGLKVVSIILETSFLGSIILYIYNYFIASKKYEIIPATIKSRLNLFIIIAIISFIAFLIVKFVMYMTSNITVKEDEQLQMDFDEISDKNVKDNKLRDLEAPVTERVYIYNNDYQVPIERQIHCSNCGSIVDKNAYICLKCGYLLKNIVQERIVEKTVVKPSYIRKPINKAKLTGILINCGLILGIMITLFMILELAAERGIIG